MKIKRRSWKERIIAFALALLLVFSGIIPNNALVSHAEETEETGQTGTSDTDESETDESESNETEPPVAVPVTFAMKDEDGNLINDAEISITAADGAPISPESSGEYLLNEGASYSYTVSKLGYVSVTNDFTVSANMDPITVTLSLRQIEVDINGINIHPRDEQAVNVINADANLTYTWSIIDLSDPDIVELDTTQGTSVKVTANKAGTATLHVECDNGAYFNIPISINQIGTKISLSADPGNSVGDKVSSVELTVTDLPADAEGHLEYYVDGTRVYTSTAFPLETSWTYNSDDIIGNMTFKAVYSGDARYIGSVTADVSASYKRNQPLEIEEGRQANETIRDDAKEDQKTFKVPVKEDTTGRTRTYISSDENVATISADGEIKILAPGKTEITVTAKGNEKYTEATIKYKLIVQKVIDISKSTEVQWEPYSKVYDGNADVELTAVLPGVNGGPSENVKVTFSAKMDDANAADTAKDATITGDPFRISCEDTSFSEEQLKELYAIENYNSIKVSGKVIVERRKVYIQTGDVELVYGQDLAAAVSGLNVDSYMTIKQPSSGENDGLVKGEQIKLSGILNLKLVLDGSISSTEVECIEYPEVIKTSIPAGGIINGNYVLMDAREYGSLTVKQETLSLEDILKRISINNKVSGVKQDGEIIYVRGDNTDSLNNGENTSAELKGQIINDAADYYSSIKFKYTDNGVEQTIDLTRGHTFGGASRTISGQIYLESTKGVTNALDGVRNLTIYIDSDSPEVTFGSWKEGNRVLGSWISTVTFGQYQGKSNYTLEGVTKTDLPAENGSGVSIGSGEASWSYYIVRRSPDNNGDYAEVTAQDIKNAVSESGWTAINSNGPASIPVVVSESGNLDDIADYYVVLVKVVDEVGNAAVYASNGLVVDVVEPSITITDENGNSFVDGFIYKTETVPYQVVITDYANSGVAASGIKNYVLTVTNKGTTTYETSEELADSKASYTIEELQTKLMKIITDEVNSLKNNSNDVNIHIEATDQSGTIKTVDQPLMIDLVDPTIEVSFDNNNVRNEKYFNAGRVMTLKFTERNFDKDKVTFDVQAAADLSSASIDKGIKVSELSKYGIKAEWVSDSESGVDIKKYTDSRVNTLRLTFSTDNEYYIVPHCVDNVGRKNAGVTYAEGSQAVNTFVIDTKKPEIEVTYVADKDISADASQRTYTQNNVTAIVKITEKNFYEDQTFAENQMVVNVTGTEAPEGILDYQELAEQGWSQVIHTYTNRLTFEKDANYTFGFTYTDLAGNTATYAPRYFTVDDTVPTGSITIKESKWDAFWETVSFGIYRSETVTATLTSDDITAGVKSAQYYVYVPDAESKGEFTALTKTDLDKVTAWTNGTSVSIMPNQQGFVYMRIVDYADNLIYINAKEGVVADNIAPSGPQITITTAEPSQGIYNGDVPFNISVVDPENGGTYAGLKEVFYKVTSNGVETQSGDYNSELANKAARIQSLSKDEVVNAGLNNTNFVQIEVTAVDYAGNQSTATKDLKIDITKPVVSINYDLNSPSNGRYYNQVRTATVTVQERNFDPNQVDFTITNTDGTMPVISDWSVDASGTSDEAVNTCTVTFAADGDYTITMNCTDRANNRSEYTVVDEFTIDRTVPVISVSFDNNNSLNGTYYSAPRTATITVNEHNFNGSELQAAIVATLQSQGISVPGVNGWASSGDIHTATIYFSADGDYSFTLNYTDLAGNAAQTYVQSQFTVDQTKPVVEIFDIVHKSANNGEVAPGVRYSDVNADVSGVSIKLHGAKHETVNVDGERTSIPNGQSIKMADFEHVKSVDDVYTLTATVTDMAGNVEEQSVTFSVNRFGSTYVYGKDTETFIDKYYNNKEEDIVVTEINVDTLLEGEISYGRDGNLVKLTKGTDYMVKESGTEVSWKSYEYTINAENFKEEGLYDVTLASKDRATNVMNNKVKELNIEFVIDKTAPTVVVTGIEEDTYRANHRDISIAVSDNVEVGTLDIYIDGETQTAEPIKAEEIKENKGQIPFSIGASNHWQNVKAVAVDAAGNRAETEEIRVLVTPNIFYQILLNTPVLIGTIVVLILAVALIYYFLILGKRRKKEKK